MQKSTSLYLTVIMLVLLFVSMIVFGCSKGRQKDMLLVYAGAALKDPLEDIAEIFSRESEVEVRFIFNSSGRLLLQLEQAREGDLFIPGDDCFLARAENDGLVRESVTAARQVPVIVVRQGNPKEIYTLSDLAGEGIRVILADQTTAMGKCAYEILQNSGLHKAVLTNVTAELTTAPQVALAVHLGQGDAGITSMNCAIRLGDSIELIPIAPELNVTATVAAGILTFAGSDELARDFMTFLNSQRSRQIFLAHGFVTD